MGLGYLMQTIVDLCGELGLAFCLAQLSTQVPSLTFKECWELGLAFCSTQLSTQVRSLTFKECWELGLAFCSTQLSTQVPSLTFKGCWELGVGSSFLLNPTLNTSPQSHLQKMLSCKNPCHTWDVGLGTPCKVVSPNLHALNGWDCTNWAQVTWDLGLGILCKVVSPNFHALNGWDCTYWARVTWDLGPMWTGPHISLIDKVETIQAHFTLGDEGLWAQRNCHQWKIYMDSYM